MARVVEKLNLRIIKEAEEEEEEGDNMRQTLNATYILTISTPTQNAHLKRSNIAITQTQPKFKILATMLKLRIIGKSDPYRGRGKGRARGKDKLAVKVAITCAPDQENGRAQTRATYTESPSTQGSATTRMRIVLYKISKHITGRHLAQKCCLSPPA